MDLLLFLKRAWGIWSFYFLGNLGGGRHLRSWGVVPQPGRKKNTSRGKEISKTPLWLIFFLPPLCLFFSSTFEARGGSQGGRGTATRGTKISTKGAGKKNKPQERLAYFFSSRCIFFLPGWGWGAHTHLSFKVDRGRPPNPIYVKGRSTFKEAAKTHVWP